MEMQLLNWAPSSCLELLTPTGSGPQDTGAGTDCGHEPKEWLAACLVVGMDGQQLVHWAY